MLGVTRLKQEVITVMKIYVFMFNHLKMTYTFSTYNKEFSTKKAVGFTRRNGFTAYNAKKFT